jgi:hypothetical protein
MAESEFKHRVETCVAKLKLISLNTPRDLTKNNQYVTLLFNLMKECEPLAISDRLINAKFGKDSSSESFLNKVKLPMFVEVGFWKVPWKIS